MGLFFQASGTPFLIYIYVFIQINIAYKSDKMHNSRRLLAIQRNVGLMFKAILAGVFLADRGGVPNSNQFHVLTGGIS